MRLRKNLVSIALALAGLTGVIPVAQPVHAHPLAPSLLELRESRGGVVAVRFRTPRVQSAGAALRPELPAACRARSAPTLATDASSATLRWQIDCGPGGLRGAALRVAGLRASGSDALLRVDLADGELVRAVLRPGAESFVIPPRAARLDLALDYLRMGFDHLLGGADHLLFVLGLVLLLRDGRKLLAAVTGFTLGHSLTLSLATLGMVQVPSAPVEVGIAVSLFWLATRLAREGQVRERLAHPFGLAAALGLLHGLGFAGALAQVGTPFGEIPLVLFAFNLGIEIGQLALVGVLFAFRALLRPLAARLPGWLERAPAYAIGTTAAALVFERLAAGLL
jgi:hypothetical protein